MATVYNDVMTTNALSDAMRTIYSADLEFTAQTQMVFDQFAEQKGDFKAERGEQVVWTIYRNTAPAIAQLTENQDVDARRISEFQVSFTVHEYGTAFGTTEKLDLLSYHGKISEIVRDNLAPHMALTVDILARNAAWAGAPKRFAAGRVNRAALTSSDVMTIDAVKQAAFQLSKNRVPLRGGDYICVAHPAVIYDLKEDTEWENTGIYSDPSRLMTGEVGRIRGVRFIESHNARLPNAGSTGGPVQTTLAVAAATNDPSRTITVALGTGIIAGDEITLFSAAQTLPDGTGGSEESVVVESVTGNDIVLANRLLLDHPIGTKVRKAPDIYPSMFLGAIAPYGKGTVLAPEVRVALPTDKLRRISYVGWYGLFGYGALRDWTYLVHESCASQDGSYEFSW